MSSGGSLARGPPGRGWRHGLGGHHQDQRDHDVGPPGPHGAPAVGACHQLAQGVGHAALDAVPDHDAGAKARRRPETAWGGGIEELTCSY